MASADVSAHRRDEYLQAARVALLPDRVTVQLDLTPGIEVAEAIVTLVDRNRDGSLSAEEQHAYASGVVGALDVRLDDTRLPLQVNASVFPAMASMRGGEGTIRIEASAAHHALSAGAHHLFLRNTHQRHQSVYLANALVPATTRVTVLDQRRDERQTELTIDYSVHADAVVPNTGWVLAGLPIVALLLLRVTRRS